MTGHDSTLTCLRLCHHPPHRAVGALGDDGLSTRRETCTRGGGTPATTTSSDENCPFHVLATSLRSAHTATPMRSGARHDHRHERGGHPARVRGSAAAPDDSTSSSHPKLVASPCCVRVRRIHGPSASPTRGRALHPSRPTIATRRWRPCDRGLTLALIRAASSTGCRGEGPSTAEVVLPLRYAIRRLGSDPVH